MNYLLPGDVPRLCARHRVTGLTCVPPLWIQIAEQNWPDEARATLRYFANTGGRMPQADPGPAAGAVPVGEAVPHVRTDRGVPLDLSRSGGGRPPARLDRQGDPERRDPGGATRRVAVRSGRGGRARPSRRRTWRSATGTTRSARRSVSGRCPVATSLGARRNWRSGRATPWSPTTRASCTSSGASDDMIKTSGYRVSPTEIEEVAYATGLVRDAVALGVEDAALGQRVRAGGGAGGDGARRRRAARRR